MFNAIYYDLLSELTLRIEELEAQKENINQRIDDLKVTARVVTNILNNNDDDIPLIYDEYYVEE